MINYISHWEWVLTKSRGSIVNNIQDFEFRSICPIESIDNLTLYYKESIDWDINRTKNYQLNSIAKLIEILKKIEENSFIHIFTLKSGFIYMISKLFVKKDFKAILSVTGLGYLFSEGFIAKVLRIVLRPLFFLLINKTYVVIIFQNIDDKNTFLQYSKYKNKVELVKSSGIDTKKYILKNNFNDKLKVLFASRLLKDKGVFEFIELAKSLKNNNFEFFIAGDLDPGNPSSLNFDELNEIKKLDFIDYLGFIDIENELHNYDVFVSLSAQEGFSRTLLESSFVGLFILGLENNGTKFISELDNSKLITSLNIENFKKELKNLNSSDLSLSLKNQDLIRSKYSSNAVANKFKKIYEILN